MAEVLVLAGTRYFGRRPVSQLHRHGYGVGVAFRGMRVDNLVRTVLRIRLLRSDLQSRNDARSGCIFDMIHHCIGCSPRAPAW